MKVAGTLDWKGRESSIFCPFLPGTVLRKTFEFSHKALISILFSCFSRIALMFVRLLLLPLYSPATLPRKKLTEVLVDYLKYRPCYFQP